MGSIVGADRFLIHTVRVTRRFDPRAAYAARYTRSGKKKKYIKLCEANRGPRLI